jgi:hypothetical protein
VVICRNAAQSEQRIFAMRITLFALWAAFAFGLSLPVNADYFIPYAAEQFELWTNFKASFGPNSLLTSTAQVRR